MRVERKGAKTGRFILCIAQTAEAGSTHAVKRTVDNSLAIISIWNESCTLSGGKIQSSGKYQNDERLHAYLPETRSPASSFAQSINHAETQSAARGDIKPIQNHRDPYPYPFILATHRWRRVIAPEPGQRITGSDLFSASKRKSTKAPNFPHRQISKHETQARASIAKQKRKAETQHLRPVTI